MYMMAASTLFKLGSGNLIARSLGLWFFVQTTNALRPASTAFEHPCRLTCVESATCRLYRNRRRSIARYRCCTKIASLKDLRYCLKQFSSVPDKSDGTTVKSSQTDRTLNTGRCIRSINNDATHRYHQMAGRSGRAGVSRGEDSGRAAQGVDTACGESFLILPVSLRA